MGSWLTASPLIQLSHLQHDLVNRTGKASFIAPDADAFRNRGLVVEARVSCFVRGKHQRLGFLDPTFTHNLTVDRKGCQASFIHFFRA